MANTYSLDQLRQLAANAGFQGADIDTISRIALAESGGNPTNRYTTPREDSFGLLQINAKAWGYPMAEASLDPQTAFNNAYKISKGGTDFTPWTTYTSGKYRTGLHAAGGDMPGGYYRGPGEPGPALHLTLRPGVDQNDPMMPAMLLDSLLNQHEQQTQTRNDPFVLINQLLGQAHAGTGAAGPTAAAPAEFIEPPGPVTPAPNLIDQAPLGTGQMTPQPPAAQIPAAVPAATAPPSDLIEPPARGQAVPAAPTAPAAPPSPGSSLINQLLQGATSSLRAGGGSIAPAINQFGRGAAQGLFSPGAQLRENLPQMTPTEQAGAAVGRIPGGMLVEPVRAGAQALRATMSGQPVGAQEMVSAAMPAMTGSIGAGGMGAGPRLPVPRRVEPPALRETLPAVGGAGPPGPPRGGLPGPVAPRPEPGPVPADMVRAETAPERGPRDTTGGESKEMKAMRLLAMRETQDKLFNVWTKAEEFKLRTLRAFSELPTLSGEEKLQVERYMEWQPGMPPVPAPSGDAMRLYNEVIKPAQLSAARDFAYLKRQRATEHLMPEAIEDLTEGYIHRIRANIGAPDRSPFDPFGGVRALRQKTSSMRGRAGWYVMQDEAGNRVFSRNTLDRQGYKYGQKVDINGKQWEVRPPTTAEIEANTDVRYLHDPVLASMQNMVQLRLARMNVEALHKDILPDLESQGLATTSREAAQKLGFTESILPALRGHFFEPRLTHAFDDFYRTPSVLQGDVAQTLSMLNRFAISAMFLNPIGHMRNVVSDFALGRGGAWLNPGSYPAAIRAAQAAWEDVRTGSPFYRDVMKAGGSLMGAGQENRIAYQMLFEKARRELTTLPNIDAIARHTGIWNSAKEMAEGLWNGSQKVMWGFHDLLLLARVRELMQTKRLGLQSAVHEAERFIADYRVPATIGEDGKVIGLPKPFARALSIAMQDRTAFVFGRYHYNKLHALANVLRDAGSALTRSGMSAGERAEALGRFGALLLFSTVLQYSVNKTLQAVTGNPQARAHVPGALGIPANLARVGSDIAQGQGGEALYDFSMAMASVVTPMPALVEVAEQLFNKDLYGRQDIAGSQLPVGEQMLQRGAHAAGQMLSPIREAIDVARGKGIPSLGISTPDPAAVERATRPHSRERRYQHKAIQRQFPEWIRHAVGGS